MVSALVITQLVSPQSHISLEERAYLGIAASLGADCSIKLREHYMESGPICVLERPRRTLIYAEEPVEPEDVPQVLA